MCVCPHCTDKHSETAFDNHISTMDKGSTRLSNMDCADNSDEEWIFAIITDTYGPHHANTHSLNYTHKNRNTLQSKATGSVLFLQIRCPDRANPN